MSVLILFSVVLLHELGHTLAALRLGYHIETIELYPFGGVAKLGGKPINWDPRDEALIAVSGPLVNLILVVVTLILTQAGWWDQNSGRAFVGMNLTILFFNLLPALPLDGGRIARAMLAKQKGFLQATEVLTRMALFLSVLFVGFGAIALWLGYPEAGMLVLGVFLLVSAFTLTRHNHYDMMRFLDHKRRERIASQPLRTLIVVGGTEIGKVAAQFVPGAYHMVYVQNLIPSESVPNRVLLQSPLQESEILQAIFVDGKWSEPISSLLRTSEDL